MQWQDTGAVPPRSLKAARLQLHYGALVLGSAAHSVLQPADDDSHTNLGFDRETVQATSDRHWTWSARKEVQKSESQNVEE